MELNWLGGCVLGALFLLLSGWMLFSQLRARKRLEDRLRSGFGRAPDAEEQYRLDGVARYDEQRAAQAQGEGRVDDITWNDLDMDALYRRVNVCLTSAGEARLYRLLREPEESDAEACEKRMAPLAEEALRFQVQRLLLRAGKEHHSAMESLLFAPAASRIRPGWLFPLLLAAEALSLPLWFFWPAAGLALLIAAVAASSAFSMAYRLRIDAQLRGLRYLASLLWAARRLCAIQGDAWRACIAPVREVAQPLKRLRGLLSGDASFMAGDLLFVWDLLRMLVPVDLVLFNRRLAFMQREQERVQRFYEAIGDIDVALCVLSLRESLHFWCRPDFTQSLEIRFERLYHPLLAHPVDNSGHVGRSTLITGSNASGKSTFIRSLALGMIMARSLHTCCAQRLCVRRMPVFTSMALRDDLLAGESYFVTEIKSLRRILEAVRRGPCACFVDEILRGTNTPERLAASTAVLRWLHGQDCLCAAATHDLELTRILREEYACFHFRERLENGEILFDYRLYPGPSRTRNAIGLLRVMGLDADIVDEAERLAGRDEEEETASPQDG